MSIKAKFKSMMTGKKKYAVIGAVAIGAYLLMRGKGGPGLTLKPISIKPGEAVSAQSYRVIAERRPGLEYTAASGSVGGDVSFSYGPGGTFTRNVVEENGVLMVEIAP